MKKIAYTKPEIEIQNLEIESMLCDSMVKGGESGDTKDPVTGNPGTDGDAKDFSTPGLWD